MSDTPTTPNRPGRDPLENPFGRSIMFEKLSPDLRRTLDQAIVDRDPPTFRGVYDKFHLADSGVSYYDFYRYARKLRARADRLHLTDLVLPDDTDLSDAMPRLIAQQLLDALLSDETPAPEEVLRLTRAYRLATQTYIAKRRFAPNPTPQSEPERKRGALLPGIARLLPSRHPPRIRLGTQHSTHSSPCRRGRRDPACVPSIPHPLIGLVRVFSTPTSTAARPIPAGLDPPTPRSHSPTLLSERRKDKRRARRRERHRRRHSGS